VIVPSQQKRRPAIAARNRGTSPVTVPTQILVLVGSVTALELAPNVTNVARKVILLVIALPAVLVVDTVDTAAAKATVVADTVGGARLIRTATHVEALATWPEIALRGRDRSATTVVNLDI